MGPQRQKTDPRGGLHLVEDAIADMSPAEAAVHLAQEWDKVVPEATKSRQRVEESLASLHTKVDAVPGLIEASSEALMLRVHRGFAQARRETDDALAKPQQVVLTPAQMADLRAALAAPVAAAGNAGAVRVSGAALVGAAVMGLASQPVETVKAAKDVGPDAAAIALGLFVVTLIARRLAPAVRAWAANVVSRVRGRFRRTA